MNTLRKLKKLRENNNLTPKEQILSSYILNNVKRIPQLSMEQLANNCNTSTGTIQRLIQKLNLEGFTDFKQKLLKNNFKSNDSINIDINNLNKRNNPYTHLVKKIADKSQEQIIETIKNNFHKDENSFLNNIYSKFLNNAENIIIFDNNNGFGYQLSQLLFKQNYFNKYSNSIKEVEETIDCSAKALKRKKEILECRFKENLEVFKMIDFSLLFSKENFLNNLLIIISMDNYNDNTEKLAKKANENDFNIIIFHNEEQKGLIENSLYDMEVNLGKTVSIKEKKYQSKQLKLQLFLELMELFYKENN